MSAYVRQAVARSGAGFTVSGNSAVTAADATFPIMAGGAGGTWSYYGVGRAVSGNGELLFFGAVSPTLSIVAGVTPILAAGSSVSNATPDGMTNSAATNLLLLLFNNTTWANIGDATGLPGSATAGSFYISIHTSSPGEGENQSTNEISYT